MNAQCVSANQTTMGRCNARKDETGRSQSRHPDSPAGSPEILAGRGQTITIAGSSRAMCSAFVSALAATEEDGGALARAAWRSSLRRACLGQRLHSDREHVKVLIVDVGLSQTRDTKRSVPR